MKGRINGSDVKVLRKWANPQRVLNLADCRIVAGGDPYYEDYTTEDDVIGSYMFADKEFKSLVLPNTLKKIGDYAITFCGDSITLPSTLEWIGDHAFTNNFFKKLQSLDKCQVRRCPVTPSAIPHFRSLRRSPFPAVA